MKRRHIDLLLLAFATAIPSSGFAQSAVTPGGLGTQVSPYLISELGHLVWIGENVSSSSNRWYLLLNNMDASATAGWNGGIGFTPIGSFDALFSGVFQGGGFAISNLVINRPTDSGLGLFGYIGPAGEARNLSLPGISVTGNFRLGALAGENRGTITRCSSTGTISGNHNMGGLVGDNIGFFGGPARIENSYSHSSVLASGYETGGLVGWNAGEIHRCYSTGAVTENDDFNGGLVGANDGSVSESYWDTETSGQNTSDGGSGKTTAHMQQQATFENWDFTAVWRIQEEASYPYHAGILSYQNLNFEMGLPGSTSAEDALPNWVAKLDDMVQTEVLGPQILTGQAAIMMAWYSPPFVEPLEGNLSVYLSGAGGTNAVLEQTAYVPVSAQSIRFTADFSGTTVPPATFDVSLGDQLITTYSLGSGQYGGNLSGQAGTVATLAFTAVSSSPDQQSILGLDSIYFSSAEIPAGNARPSSIVRNGSNIVLEVTHGLGATMCHVERLYDLGGTDRWTQVVSFPPPGFGTYVWESPVVDSNTVFYRISTEYSSP